MIEKVSYAGWPNCYRLADDRIELIATGDMGSRDEDTIEQVLGPLVAQAG